MIPRPRPHDRPGTRFGVGVARRLAATLVLLAMGPGSPFGPSPASAGFEPHVFVVTTDFGATGSSSAVDIESPWSADVNVEGVGSDPIVRHFFGRHYVVNRFLGDNVQVIDPASFSTVRQFSTGAGTNPHDIVVVSETKAYVSAYDGTDVLIVDPSSGTVTGGIDLGAFADADGLPELNAMALADDRLFVQVQRLDRDAFYTPVAPSYLAVIDVSTDTLVDADPVAPGTQAIALTGTNPVCKMELDPISRRLYVACVGSYGALDGGIDVVDTETLQDLGLVVTESALGGDVGCLTMCSATTGFVLSSTDFFFTTDLRGFDTSGALGPIVYTTESYTEAMDCDAPTGTLFLGVRDVSAPGVRVFDASSGAPLTGAPVDVGLPPADLVISRPGVVDVGDASMSETPAVSASPNPLRSSVLVRFLAAPGDRVRVEIFDATGRSVRVLAERLDARNGWNTVTWDARDASGSPVAPGVYWLRVSDRGTDASPASGTARGRTRAQVTKLVVVPR